MTKHVGIVGCSAEGASLCYRTICSEGSGTLGNHGHPEVSMHTPPLSNYMACLERGDIEGVGDLMLASAHKLERAGADFLICPDNTIHQAFAYVEPRSSLPWLHIAETVAREAVARRHRKLALLGTRWLVESEVYPAVLQARGVEVVKPDIEIRIEIDRLIFEDLVKGIFHPTTVGYFRNVIETMARQGCDAVILGCTEIPLIIDNENSQLPILDSTRLLARAALRHAIS